MTSISPPRARESRVEKSLKPVLYTVFLAKFIVAAMLVATVNLPTPSAHAGPTAIAAGDF